MATEKERELMREIMDLALDIGAGDHSVDVDYSGHVHSFDVRISKKGDDGYIWHADTVYLSGRNGVFTEKKSIGDLFHILLEVRKHHKDYDADGIRLEVVR